MLKIASTSGGYDKNASGPHVGRHPPRARPGSSIAGRFAVLLLREEVVPMARRKNAPESDPGQTWPLRPPPIVLTDRILWGAGRPRPGPRTLGIPVRTWYNYENGVTVPAEIILRIVELTSVEPVWLLRGEGPKFRPRMPTAPATSPGHPGNGADGQARRPGQLADHHPAAGGAGAAGGEGAVASQAGQVDHRPIASGRREGRDCPEPVVAERSPSPASGSEAPPRNAPADGLEGRPGPEEDWLAAPAALPASLKDARRLDGPDRGRGGARRLRRGRAGLRRVPREVGRRLGRRLGQSSAGSSTAAGSPCSAPRTPRPTPPRSSSSSTDRARSTGPTSLHRVLWISTPHC